MFQNWPPEAVAALREIVIAILVALLGLLGYDRAVAVPRATRTYNRALADMRADLAADAQPTDPHELN